MKRGLIKFALIFAVSAAGLIIGIQLGPLVYPYKLFMSDSFSGILSIRISRLSEAFTYLNPDALYAYTLFAIVFAISYFAIGLRSAILSAIWALFVGIYFDIMIDGTQANGIYRAYEALLGFRPDDSILAKLGYFAVYGVAMLGPPITLCYLLFRVEKLRSLSVH
jgi:hypothetical protein